MAKRSGRSSAARAAEPSKTITLDEIYHRLEWYFDRSHDPKDGHTISPEAPIGGLLGNLTLQDLWRYLNQASHLHFPAWKRELFDGVQIPWITVPNVSFGIQDVKKFRDLIKCLELAYKHFGWTVIEPEV